MMSTNHRHLNIKGGLMDLSSPVVMGILNVTPDSFYSASRSQTASEIETRLHQIVGEGAGIIDIGAYSSRPGAEDISADEEMRRLASALEIVKRLYPEAVVSIDTFRAEVARRCVEEYGADIINDISGGELDDKMFDMAARLNVPYILMHMKGRPQDMQQHTSYDNFIQEVFTYFARKVQTLHGMGVKDIILDPGFGFSKTLEQNYELMARMAELK
jgi:dihydropteroate synthase